MIKKVVLSNRELTQEAISLFGDIVKEAFYATDYLINEDYTKEILKNSINDSFEDGIDLDSSEVCIRFTTGKIISFSTSEWGLIYSVDYKDIYKIYYEL